MQSDPSVLKCVPEYVRSDPVVVMEAAKSALSMSTDSRAENLMNLMCFLPNTYIDIYIIHILCMYIYIWYVYLSIDGLI